MERLTEKIWGRAGLKAYGNTLCKDICAEYDEDESCISCPIQKAIEKLGDYEDLEEQGLLKIFPCKPGDHVYDIKYGYVRKSQVTRYDMAQNIGKKYKEHIHTIFNGFHGSFLVSEIGKTVFLTQEGAEQALRKRSRTE